MWYVPCRVISAVPKAPTEPVTVEITDAMGRRYTFRDKLAIVRSDDDTSGVSDGIRCRLLRVGRLGERFAYWISTAEPDHVAAEQDEQTEFVVSACVFSAQPAAYRHRYAEIPREMPEVSIDIDFLQHRIALALGVLPRDTPFGVVKWMYWTAPSEVGDFTLAVIAELLAMGEIVKVGDDATVFSFRGC